MEDLFDLNRFLEAQLQSYSLALNEIRSGKKISHWMWYIFPQFDGLGYSTISKRYAIKSKEEALAYLKHEILGNRLIEITKSLYLLKNKSAYDILGSTDSLKLKSCMSLFALIQNEVDLFQIILEKYFHGKYCKHTESVLNGY
jgi:uncharacterized protein (DUF1810 family)